MSAEQQKLKEIIEGLTQKYGNIVLPDLVNQSPQDVIEQFWPIIKVLLVFLRDLPKTGPKLDEEIDEIIVAGDQLKDNPLLIKDFQKKLKSVWIILKPVLHAVALFTPGGISKVIEVVIKVIDWFVSKEIN